MRSFLCWVYWWVRYPVIEFQNAVRIFFFLPMFQVEGIGGNSDYTPSSPGHLKVSDELEVLLEIQEELLVGHPRRA